MHALLLEIIHLYLCTHTKSFWIYFGTNTLHIYTLFICILYQRCFKCKISWKWKWHDKYIINISDLLVISPRRSSNVVLSENEESEHLNNHLQGNQDWWKKLPIIKKQNIQATMHCKISAIFTVTIHAHCLSKTALTNK